MKNTEDDYIQTMKELGCNEHSWEFPWEQEYEEYLESQEDYEDEYYEDDEDEEDEE